MGVLPQPPVGVPFEFDHVGLRCATHACHALVMWPRTPIVFGDQRKEAITGTARLSPVERELLGYVGQRPADTPILILRGADDAGQRLWSFDRRFGEQELEAVGQVFSRAVLPFYRGLLARGIVLFIHSDWGHREIGPIRRGLATLADALAGIDRDPQLAAVDDWITRNMLLYSSLSVDHILEDLLPTHLGLLQRRAQRVARMLEALPEELVA